MDINEKDIITAALIILEENNGLFCTEDISRELLIEALSQNDLKIWEYLNFPTYSSYSRAIKKLMVIPYGQNLKQYLINSTGFKYCKKCKSYKEITDFTMFSSNGVCLECKNKKLFEFAKREKTDTVNIIVPVSGGKDSTASLLLALEKFPDSNIIAIFNDTGWDHPDTYSYLKYLEKETGIKIYKTTGAMRKDGQAAETLEELIIAQGRFPFGLGRFCTKHLKQLAMKKYYESNIYKEGVNWEVWFGMRTQESSGRKSKYGGIEYSDLFDMGDIFPGVYPIPLRKTLSVRLPVVEWSEKQVFDYIASKGLEVNPLYHGKDPGTRVGCYPCMLAKKSVQEEIFSTEYGKGQLEKIKVLEEKIGQKYEMYDTDQGSCEVCKI